MDRSFSPAARAEANRQIAELKSEHAPLDRERFHDALLRITALADNGHTNLHYGKGGPQNFIPLRVVLFADGLYVLRAKSAYADLLGARVESIEGRPTRDVIAALEQLHGGTEGWRRTYAAIYIQSPEILCGDAIGSRPDETINLAVAERQITCEKLCSAPLRPKPTISSTSPIISRSQAQD
jgi:hypothetical protein